MKITQVRLGRISVPLRVPFKTALRTVNSVEDVVVELHTDTGAVGYGEAPPTGVITGDTTGAIVGAIREHIAPAIVGRDIDEFEGRALSPYRTELVPVSLYEDELSAYQSCRQRYVEFLRSCRVDLSRPDGWQQFLRACSQASNGREAFEAYLEQRRLSRSCRAKFEAIWRLLCHHRGERTLVFTADNPTAYEIGQRFCLPVLTHHTRIAERRDLLSAFRSGELPALVTSRILNEGVDVPEASVGIVVSGTGSVREHVQRLGRILRPASGKQAVLYELVSVGTGEEGTSDRRRQHRAYGRPDGLAGLGRQEAPIGC